MGEIFRVVYHDSICVDDALASVAREDLLRHKLVKFPSYSVLRPLANLGLLSVLVTKVVTRKKRH